MNEYTETMSILETLGAFSERYTEERQAARTIKANVFKRQPKAARTRLTGADVVAAIAKHARPS